MRYGTYPEEADDVREEFQRMRHGRRRMENNCQGAPICGCPICEPPEQESDDEQDE